MNEKLRKALESVPDTYSDFVNGLCSTLEDYEEWQEKLIQYIQDNPDAQTDDCIEFLDEFFESTEDDE